MNNKAIRLSLDIKNKTLRSVLFGVVVVELINCKCGGIVRMKYGKSKVLICEIMGFVRIF